MTVRCVASLFSASIIGIAIKASSFAYAQRMPIFGGFEVKTLTKEEKHYQTAAYICSLKLEEGPSAGQEKAWELNFASGRSQDDETIVYSIVSQVCP